MTSRHGAIHPAGASPAGPQELLPGSGPGHLQPSTFEDTLRELLAASPYLGVSVLVHGLILLSFLNQMLLAPAEEPERVLVGTPPEIVEPIPPEPPPSRELDPVEQPVEDPVVSEDELTEMTDLTDAESILPDESTNLHNVLGVGPGGGGFSGKLKGRGGPPRPGGDPTARVVDDALNWLRRHQNQDGYWSCAAFDLECNPQGDDVPCDGLGNPQFDVGSTGLALLAFLGAGHTDRRGRYRKTVKDGLRFLVDVAQQPDGNLAQETNGQYTYDHIIATLALCEAAALTRRPYLKQPANRALDYMYSIRNPGGAWRYADFHPEMAYRTDDTSVTGWAVLAMTLAQEYDLSFDADALADAMAFLDEMTDETGRTGYYDRGGEPAREGNKAGIWDPALSESMTAVGILCRIFAHPSMDDPRERDLIARGVRLIGNRPLRWPPEDSSDYPGTIDYYYWYYATYALYQYAEIDARPWNAWEKLMVRAIAEHQHKQGERKGSWDPQVDPWGHMGGRVYATAINALTMEVFYRYDHVIGSHD